MPWLKARTVENLPPKQKGAIAKSESDNYMRHENVSQYLKRTTALGRLAIVKAASQAEDQQKLAPNTGTLHISHSEHRAEAAVDDGRRGNKIAAPRSQKSLRSLLRL